MPKTECLVIKAYNDDLLVTIDEKVYELKELERNKKVSLEFDTENIIVVKEDKKYTKDFYPTIYTRTYLLDNFGKIISNETQEENL